MLQIGNQQRKRTLRIDFELIIEKYEGVLHNQELLEDCGK